LFAQPTYTNWQEYLGGPDSSHYSPLKQINRDNVDKLEIAWTYETGDDLNYTFSPLVIDNVAYFAAKHGSLVAVDASNCGHTRSRRLRAHPPHLRDSAESRANAAGTTGRAKTEAIDGCLFQHRDFSTRSTPGPASWSILLPSTANST
jgi:quinoprotein glucose dehydrogenase